MMIKKILKCVVVKKTFSTTWPGLQWNVLAIYERKFLWLHWAETVSIAGPFNSKEEAKRCAKKFRKSYNL